MGESFLNGRVVLHSGDCLDVLARLDECSVDSCVTDPPYHLTSIVQRFGAGNAAPAQFGSDGRYARASAGFMGKQWDGGAIAFDPATWRAVYRVLKPGAHLIACGGTRTYHRMACSIEDAGFEIRDTISWLYGSGFPKSHDVSKGIDRAAGAEREKISKPNPPAYQRSIGNTRPWMDNPNHLIDGDEPATDAARQWEGWGTALKPACELIVLARKPLSEGTVAANVLRWGTGAINVDGCRVATNDSLQAGARKLWSHYRDGKEPVAVTGQRPYDETWESDQLLCASCAERVASTTKPITPEIRASIATKPVAPTTNGRDDLSQADIFKLDIGCSDGTRAEDTSINSNTVKSGNGTTDQFQTATKSITPTGTRPTTGQRICGVCGAPITRLNTPSTRHGRNGSQPMPQDRASTARWPANVAHDGSDEVTAGFPETGMSSGGGQRNGDKFGGGYAPPGQDAIGFGDTGSAGRFFYTAKADADDRLGSKHPTVKPLDLMQWLVRLVTPRNGVVLDPFSGTGTTGEAAIREGMRAVLIEAEPEYQADIRRRMALVMAGPDERSRESIKAKNLPVDYGPLFGFPEAAE